MKHIDYLELAVRLQRRIDGMELPVVACVSYSEFIVTSSYLTFINTTSHKCEFTRDLTSMDELLQIAVNLGTPKYIPLPTNVCMQLIDTTVYHTDEHIPVTVVSLQADSLTVIADSEPFRANLSDLFILE